MDNKSDSTNPVKSSNRERRSRKKGKLCKIKKLVIEGMILGMWRISKFPQLKEVIWKR